MESEILIVVTVELEHVCKFFINVHTVVAQANLLGKDIASLILPVDVQLYRYGVVGVWSVDELPNLHCNGIDHERTMLRIGLQYPTFAFFQSK